MFSRMKTIWRAETFKSFTGKIDERKTKRLTTLWSCAVWKCSITQGIAKDTSASKLALNTKYHLLLFMFCNSNTKTRSAQCWFQLENKNLKRVLVLDDFLITIMRISRIRWSRVRAWVQTFKLRKWLCLIFSCRGDVWKYARRCGEVSLYFVDLQVQKVLKFTRVRERKGSATYRCSTWPNNGVGSTLIDPNCILKGGWRRGRVKKGEVRSLNF